jgi:hypothetical protein
MDTYNLGAGMCLAAIVGPPIPGGPEAQFIGYLQIQAVPTK